MDEVMCQLIPRLAKEGVFGDGGLIKVEKCDVTPGYQMLRIVMCVDGEEKSKRVVVKLPDGADFDNEVVMYQKVHPCLNKSGLKHYPELYYSSEDILILSDLTEKGFDYEDIFDVQHIVISIKRLAEFHSWSFNAKHNVPEDFENIKAVLKPSEAKHDWEKICAYMKTCIDQLLEQNIELLNDFLDIIQDVKQVELLSPIEPFGVVVHGNISKNVLFRCNDDKEVVDCAFQDFRKSRFASCAAELSSFLYRNTTAEQRFELWDSFLEMYWDFVLRHVQDGVLLPNFQIFSEHFALKAVHAFVQASLEKDLNTKKVREIVEDLYHRRYIHKFVEYYKSNKGS